LIALTGDLRKYCKNNEKHLLILDIQNMRAADRFPSESQFLRRVISALERPHIIRSGIFTASTFTISRTRYTRLNTFALT